MLAARTSSCCRYSSRVLSGTCSRWLGLQTCVVEFKETCPAQRANELGRMPMSNRPNSHCSLPGRSSPPGRRSTNRRETCLERLSTSSSFSLRCCRLQSNCAHLLRLELDVGRRRTTTRARGLLLSSFRPYLQQGQQLLLLLAGRVGPGRKAELGQHVRRKSSNGAGAELATSLLPAEKRRKRNKQRTTPDSNGRNDSGNLVSSRSVDKETPGHLSLRGEPRPTAGCRRT